MNHHLNGWWLKLTKQIMKWLFYRENMNPNNPSPLVKLNSMDEPIPTDWMNYMRALCPKARMWILLLMQIDPARWNSLWKNEIIRWNFMLFQNEIGFIHEFLPAVLFHPWKCIQSFFCPWNFFNEFIHNFISSIKFHPCSMPEYPWSMSCFMDEIGWKIKMK